MSGNQHHESAAHLLACESEPGGGSYIDPNTQNLLIAQAEATLALAYEQRTANLIAVMADGETNGVMPEIDYNEVAKKIKERLGL